MIGNKYIEWRDQRTRSKKVLTDGRADRQTLGLFSIDIDQDTVESKLVLVESGSKWGVCSWHVKRKLKPYKTSIV